MSVQHPIIAVTGSSGAGTTTVMQPSRTSSAARGSSAAFIEGDSFHRYDREEMGRDRRGGRRGNRNFSHFGPEANLLASSPRPSRSTPTTGRGRVRRYVHDAPRPGRYGQPPAPSPPGRTVEPGSDLLFYEGLHGAAVTATRGRRAHVDLLVGVVPIVNLEWIQKLHRDQQQRGYSQDAVIDTILRRMPDYVNTSARSSAARMSTSSACRPWTPATRSSPATSPRR